MSSLQTKLSRDARALAQLDWPLAAAAVHRRDRPALEAIFTAMQSAFLRAASTRFATEGDAARTQRETRTLHTITKALKHLTQAEEEAQ